MEPTPILTSDVIKMGWNTFWRRYFHFIALTLKIFTGSCSDLPYNVNEKIKKLYFVTEVLPASQSFVAFIGPFHTETIEKKNV